MPDSPAGSAAFLSGEEIVNDARTLAYLANGFGPLNMQISGGCACPRIRELIECEGDPYTSPAADPAPWFDSSVPESADFAGFLTTEFEGLGATYSRTPTDKVTGGAVIGRLRPGPRTMTWRGYLFGRSDCAVRYGLAWMASNLRGTNCNCGGEEMDLLVCCPELTQTPPVSGCASLPAINRPEICPPYTHPDAFRTLKNVGLLSGPTILSQRRIGCNNCRELDCAGDTLIMEIEFSLMAGNPFLFGCPVCLCVEQPFPLFSSGDCPDVWDKVTDVELAEIVLIVDAGGVSPCFGPVCPEPANCTNIETGLPECDPAVLPSIPAFTDSCFCDPVLPVQFCCEVPADSFGQFFEGAPIIEIKSGAMPMRSTTIRFFENVQGRECCDVALDPCLNCDSLQIRFIPANSTMTIDGTTRTVTVLCPGMNEPVRAEHLTVTPFAWPLLECIDFCICVESDGLAMNPDGLPVLDPAPTVTVLITPREM